MTRLFRRRPERDPRVEDAVRRSLAAHAHDAPAPDGFAERVIAAAERTEDDPYAAPALPSSSRRRPLLVPLASAAAVLVVIAGVLVAVTQLRGGHDRDSAAQSPTRNSAPLGSSSVQPSSVTVTAPPAPPASADTSRSATLPATLTGVSIADVTFTSAVAGWALGSADCLRSAGRCTALVRTTDGTVWNSHPNTPFNAPGVSGGCTAPCVDHIRFATDDIGYAFGPSALFMTTDGAQSWQRLSGGAVALETLDGTVVRVTSSPSDGCPPGCEYATQTAEIGSTHFTNRALPGATDVPGDGVSLTRTGSTAYLLATGNPAGGAQQGNSVLWTSGDDGTRWTNRGEPCAQRGGEVDGRALSSAADGSATVLCRERGSGRQFVAVTTDGGQRFRSAPSVLGSAAVTGFGAASSSTVVVVLGDTFRSTNGGRSFARLAANGGSSPGNPRYVGFASDRVGHAVSEDRRTIWTTRDAGRSWTAVRFG